MSKWCVCGSEVMKGQIMQGPGDYGGTLDFIPSELESHCKFLSREMITFDLDFKRITRNAVQRIDCRGQEREYKETVSACQTLLDPEDIKMNQMMPFLEGLIV